MAEDIGADRHKRRKRIRLSSLLGVGTLLFVALGVWQIERRGEKLALIAAVEKRVSAGPVAAPGPSDWPRISLKNDAYRHIRVGGVFLHDRETLVQAVTERGPGYWVMTPLRTDGDWSVLVNRGFVPAKGRDHAGDPSGHVTVTGLLRITEPGGGFLHSNDRAHDRWYSRDVGGIGRARHLERLAPYFIDAEAGPRQDHQPIGGLTVVRFANNHLQYAFTWFALAALSAFGLARIWRTH